MINKHYQDLSDDDLVKTHNQLFSERTTNHKNNPMKIAKYDKKNKNYIKTR